MHREFLVMTFGRELLCQMQCAPTAVKMILTGKRREHEHILLWIAHGVEKFSNLGLLRNWGQRHQHGRFFVADRLPQFLGHPRFGLHTN